MWPSRYLHTRQWGGPKVAPPALLLAMLVLALPGFGQAPQYPAPLLRFADDSVLLGSPVSLTVTVRHGQQLQLLFPDSAYPFTPFELKKSENFQTATHDTVSTDSAVYTLLYFGVERTLNFSLPVFYILSSGDTMTVSSAPVALSIRHVSKDGEAGADSLLAATQPIAIPERFNYPYWLLGLSIAAGLLLAFNAFFGRPVERFFKLLLLARRHRFFIRAFERLVSQVSLAKEPAVMERTLNLWKSYIERLENVPYSTYTTKDFAENLPDAALTRSLREIDKWIYGGFAPTGEATTYSVLRRFATRIYNARREAIRNG